MQRMADSPFAQAYKPALENAMANVGMLARAGVRIATGTDSGPPARFQGYFMHMEMQMMVDAGMSPAQVIEASTSVAADCIGLSQQVGSLQPHRWADFIVLGADPTVDIANTKIIEAVYIAGNLVPGSTD
jgi:imidazolonepropionase-like amidohydrolase